MGKYSTKGLHVNPKRKKPNKNHKQRYFKPENKKIDKSNFYEVTGNREELEPYKGEIFEAKVFVTNTFKYSGEKRLVNSLILPIKYKGKNLYVNHLWMKTEKIGHLSHGYQKIKVKIIEYPDLYNNKKKYGVQYVTNNT